jgi:methionyl aminopeptidase
MSTWEINRLGDEMIRDYGCIPSFLNYQGYPASVCVSVNDEVVHGIPNKSHLVKEGDIVSLDIGLIYKGYHSDAARTHGVGEISKEAADLILRTRQSFFEGIRFAKAGNHLFEISAAIGDYAESFHYGVVYDLVGHGIGTQMHEEPEIPNFRQRRRGLRLKSGMTLAIEPMINAGVPEVLWMDDDWTVVTEDGSLSAHYENTVLITDGEPEILTLTEEEAAMMDTNE